MKVITNLTNVTGAAFIVGTTGECTMDNLVKTNVMDEESLHGLTVPCTMVNSSRDNEKEKVDTRLPMVVTMMVHGEMENMMDMGKMIMIVFGISC